MNILSDSFKKEDKRVLADLEKLGVVIKITIEKNDIETAKKYLEFLVETTIKTLKKIDREPIPEEHNSEVNIDSYSNSKIPKNWQERSKKSSRLRQVIFTCQDLFFIFFKYAIKERHEDIFYEFSEKYFDCVDAILELEHDYYVDNLVRDTAKFYSKLLNEIVFVLGAKNAEIFYPYFVNSTTNWFNRLYRMPETTSKYFEPMEDAILDALSKVIDYDLQNSFEDFCLSLSLQWLADDFENDDFDYRNQFYSAIWSYKSELERNIVDKIFAIKKFNEIESSISLKLKTIAFENNFTDEVELEKIKQKISKKIMRLFKENYLKIIINKAIIYSIFRNKPFYLESYDSYYQPSDSDAHFVGTSYSINKPNELIALLENHYEIINSNSLFRFQKHHGFTKYLNTLIICYLNKFKYEQSIFLNLEKETLKNISFSLQKVTESYSLNYLIEINKEAFSNDNFLQKIKDIKIKIDEKIKTLIEEQTKKSQLNKESITQFHSEFEKGYNSFNAIKTLLKVNNLIKYDFFEMTADSNCYGINQLVNKQAFIVQNDLHYVDTGHSFGRSLSYEEDGIIYNKISQLCKTVNLKRIELEQYLLNNKNNFDVLISSEFNLEKYLRKSSIVEDYQHKGIYGSSSHTRVLDNYNLFYKPHDDKSETFVLLSTQKLGNLVYFNPIPDDYIIKEDKRIDLLNGQFTCSIIDLPNEQEYFDYLVEQKIDSQQLYLSVWLSVYEKFNFIKHENFNGVLIKIKD